MTRLSVAASYPSPSIRKGIAAALVTVLFVAISLCSIVVERISHASQFSFGRARHRMTRLSVAVSYPSPSIWKGIAAALVTVLFVAISLCSIVVEQLSHAAQSR